MNLSPYQNTQNTAYSSDTIHAVQQLFDFYNFLLTNWIALFVIGLLIFILWIASLISTINLNLRFKAFLNEWRESEDTNSGSEPNDNQTRSTNESPSQKDSGLTIE